MLFDNTTGRIGGNPHRSAGPGEGNVGDRQNVVVVRAAMRAEFVGMARPAVALEIIRRRHQEPPQRHDRLAHDAFAADVARLNADIVAFLDRIVDAVIVVKLDDQIGMLLLKMADIAAELMSQERGDAAHPQRAGEPDGERANGRLRLVQFGDDPHAAFEVACSGVSECQPAGRADQQLRLEPLFELFHPFGDHGFGHAKPAGGGDKAAALDDADEHPNSGQFVHG